MTTFKKTTLYPLALLLCLGLMWGTSSSMARFAMQSGITPLQYLFWETAGPACLLYLLIVLKQKKLFLLKGNQILFYLFTSLFGILFPNYLWYVSATHLPSGILGLIVNTSPIITYILSLIFIIEKFKFKRFFGIILGFLGLYLLFASKTQFVPVRWYWIFSALLVPIFLALCTVFIVKFKKPETNSLELACGMLILATIIITPITVAQGAFHPIVTLSLPNLIILLQIIISSLGFILFFELLRISGPVYYSLVSCFVALSSLGWGYVVFHESLAGKQVVSVLLIIFAIYLVGENEPKRRKLI